MTSAYLLSGESFLAEEALDKIRRTESTDVLSEVTFDPSSEAAELVEALETASLLGDRRLVVVAPRGTSSHWKPPKEGVSSPGCATGRERGA